MTLATDLHPLSITIIVIAARSRTTANIDALTFISPTTMTTTSNTTINTVPFTNFTIAADTISTEAITTTHTSPVTIINTTTTTTQASVRKPPTPTATHLQNYLSEITFARHTTDIRYSASCKTHNAYLKCRNLQRNTSKYLTAKRTQQLRSTSITAVLCARHQ